MLLMALVGWLSQRQQDAVAYLVEENRILRRHVRGRLRLTDDERRRLGTRSSGADFFTTEVWTWRGLVTYYTVFVIDLASRRVRILGSTPFPNDLFTRQVVRTLTAVQDGPVGPHRVLLCGRGTKWSAPVRTRLGEAGIRVVQTPYRAPNANVYAERFVRSIQEDQCDGSAHE